MPPTMIVTFGLPDASSPTAASLLLLRQPASALAERTAARAAARPRRDLCVETGMAYCSFPGRARRMVGGVDGAGGALGASQGCAYRAAAWLVDGGRHAVRRRSRREISHSAASASTVVI